MKITFLDAASLGPGLDDDLERFSRWGTVERWDNTSPHERAGRLRDTRVAVANRVAFDDELFGACPELKLILLTATGFNNVDLASARRHGVAVCNVVGYSTESVAQHTLALVLGLMEQTAWLDQFAKGPWAGSSTFGHLQRPFHEIGGKAWGIIGLGNIGRRVADLALAFRATPTYFSVQGVDRPGGLPRQDLRTLLSTSDIVTIHSPLTLATKGLLGAQELGWMKPSAYLVNVGRGGIIDEPALAEALDGNRLAGAALDVTLPEPPVPDNPLLHLAQPHRLLLSPHVAWASIESRHRCLDEVALNLQSWLSGEKRNRLD